MNAQTFNQPNRTNSVKRTVAAAAVFGMLMTGAPIASASTDACERNPADHGWVPIQVKMEYEARCGNKTGVVVAPAKVTPKIGCALNPAANGWVPMQVTMEYEARCK